MTAAAQDHNKVEIELGDGIRDDEVTVLVDGLEVWRGREAEPNYSSRILTVVSAALPDSGSPMVEVRARGLTGRHRPSAHRPRLRADITAEGHLTLEPATEDPTFFLS
jgi:hypothetical protein